MSYEKCVPFLSLAYELRLLIFSKMDNTEILKMKLACDEAWNFVESEAQLLSSRPYYGDDFCLEAEDGVLNFGKCDNNMKKIQVDETFIDSMALLSVNRLDIAITDYTFIPDIASILERWKPLCIYARFLHSEQVEVENLMKMTSGISSRKFIGLPFKIQSQPEIDDVIEQLKRTTKPELFHVIVFGSWQFNCTFKMMKLFGKFQVSTAPNIMDQFLTDFSGFEGLVNLKEFKFIVGPTSTQNPLLEYPPYSTFNTINLPVHGFGNDYKLKLSLKNGLCIILISKRDYSRTRSDIYMEVNGYVLKNSDEEILDFFIDYYFEKKSNTVSADDRHNFLNAIND